ncbi:uncharacterized protein K489DRAFT_41145 [Dissoconium aciculare CBS 342.82]|uniref:Uncharacterized protein n=1 Tax=Dissoconium aciculare CBS 342.82 TaxID=1314786 RepID=A0A6J3M1D4_9PEZI|nr:uncharacterized protein K489DRAFT_41145 [Dissoconium aciculare CBS 342.82]KAF1820727.1 hypothetical protein K489DRAFT_41145 [Dissoconium aciculare CBS 342.82]
MRGLSSFRFAHSHTHMLMQIGYRSDLCIPLCIPIRLRGTTMDPPSYDEITTRTDGKRTVHCLMIRDELGISRRQHVAALVDKLVPRLRERASMGLSKSPLLILPSDQAKANWSDSMKRSCLFNSRAVSTVTNFGHSLKRWKSCKSYYILQLPAKPLFNRLSNDHRCRRSLHGVPGLGENLVQRSIRYRSPLQPSLQ